MIRLSQPRSRGADATLPMINVAFLLLVFFLLAAAIRPTEAVGVDLPEIEGGTPAAQELRRITLGPGGELTEAGQAIEAAALAGASIVLRADASSSARQLAETLQRLSVAGAHSVTLLADQTF